MHSVLVLFTRARGRRYLKPTSVDMVKQAFMGSFLRPIWRGGVDLQIWRGVWKLHTGIPITSSTRWRKGLLQHEKVSKNLKKIFRVFSSRSFVKMLKINANLKYSWEMQVAIFSWQCVFTFSSISNTTSHTLGLCHLPATCVFWRTVGRTHSSHSFI